MTESKNLVRGSALPHLKPIKTTPNNNSLLGYSLGRPPKRCYACGHLSMRGREIGMVLFICSGCDEEREPASSSIVRGSELQHIEPKSAICFLCKKPLISQRKVKNQVQKLTQGDITEKDKERIEKQVEAQGWKYLSNNVYAHTRCLNKHKKGGS